MRDGAVVADQASTEYVKTILAGRGNL